MDKLNHIKIDSTHSVTDLCSLGAKFFTDKSPYNPGPNRHPYTAVYDLLFAHRRFDPIVFGEIGIAFNGSMRMWREYFPNATLYGYELDRELLEAAKSQGLRDTTYLPINIADDQMMAAGFSAAGQFDVLIDDSTHRFEHQIKFIKIGLGYMKPGGIMIVEDIFRTWDEAKFTEELRSLFPYFSSATFIQTDHANERTIGNKEPHYDNSKMLVLFRNQVS